MNLHEVVILLTFHNGYLAFITCSCAFCILSQSLPGNCASLQVLHFLHIVSPDLSTISAPELIITLFPLNIIFSYHVLHILSPFIFHSSTLYKHSFHSNITIEHQHFSMLFTSLLLLHSSIVGSKNLEFRAFHSFTLQILLNATTSMYLLQFFLTNMQFGLRKWRVTPLLYWFDFFFSPNGAYSKGFKPITHQVFFFSFTTINSFINFKIWLHVCMWRAVYHLI